jgi:3-methyladenine DNA glycosylase AlkD
MTDTARTIVGALDDALRAVADPERAVNEKRYLKSPIEHLGVTVPATRRAVRAVVRAHGKLTHRELTALVQQLWASPVHEHRMAAVNLLEDHFDEMRPADLRLIEQMIRGSFTWAYVDNLAASVAGPLVERHPELSAELDRWSGDESFWVRRAAMLALMGGLRRGGGDWKRFTRYADAMLDEKEFFIRKAIGWVLRETSKKRPELVRRYVSARLDRMPGVTFREAVKRLPEVDRTKLTRAFKARPTQRTTSPRSTTR